VEFSVRYHKGTQELARTENLMCDLIREHYMTCRTTKKTVGTRAELMNGIDEVRIERYPCDVDFGSCDMRVRRELFNEAVQ
jgi:hypothetical protein